jgi:hypothetical protein
LQPNVKLPFCGEGCETVIKIVADPPGQAPLAGTAYVIVVVPTASAVTVPFEFTVPTAGLLLVHVPPAVPVVLMEVRSPTVILWKPLSVPALGVTATVTGIANGEITLSMTAANTANLTPGRYMYDLKVTDSTDNKVTRVIEGIAVVLPSATR